ncbi:MAG TPA: hypothetical protein VM888_15590 [Chitinophagaceae bacterium]|nr:hypothetical protein [Chitinophagaceae bacterium]
MSPIATISNQFHSLLSLQPLVNVLRRMVSEGKPGARKLYDDLLKEFDAQPQLLQPVNDLSILTPHIELVESLLATIFPPSTTANEGLYAISFPFRSEIVYASPGFGKLFLKEGTNEIRLPEGDTNKNIRNDSLQLMYNVILQKLYSLQVPLAASSVHSFTDAQTGLTRYLDLKLNAQFVEVKAINKDIVLPTNFSPQQVMSVDELKDIFPLENFQFEGLVIIDVVDVTSDQVIAEIKNSLLALDSSLDITNYDKLQENIQTLIDLKSINVGITPFLKMNNFNLYSAAHYKNSLLFKNEKVIRNKEDVIEAFQYLFRNSNRPLLYGTLSTTNSNVTKVLNYYHEMGTRSLILCPLKSDDGELIGLMEIASEEGGLLRFEHLSKLQPAMQLFSLTLEKGIENLEFQIDKTIKEHFTAIQPAVEWKFTETAFNYLRDKQDHDSVKMSPITFNDVHPLYGAIDVRNSSVERNNAIQLDMLEQLNMIKSVLEKACKMMQFPLLKEIQFKVDKFISSTADNLLSDDEMIIYEFLQNDMDALFKHLHSTRPELQKTIDAYFSALDPQRNIIYHHRKEYEESITWINDALDRFIDKEQMAAQEVFPHYFERYITDGIEFNIYVGQSLAPHFEFDEIYVHNLKLWQITMLAKAAKLTNALEKRLSLPLQTTQLILAHSLPLSISFRRKERKFDVDGAYNIRYEIVKKRIDKVHLKDSDERLTQPGKIAIVYSQQKEYNEYLEYISFLQAENLLTDNIEHLDLEDTQGISGLKALRVEVNLANNDTPVSKVELSKVTSKQLLNK